MYRYNIPIRIEWRFYQKMQSVDGSDLLTIAMRSGAVPCAFPFVPIRCDCIYCSSVRNCAVLFLVARCDTVPLQFCSLCKMRSCPIRFHVRFDWVRFGHQVRCDYCGCVRCCSVLSFRDAMWCGSVRCGAVRIKYFALPTNFPNRRHR